MDDPRRVLNFPKLLNARDLGGYPTVDGASTRWRSLLRADDLAQLTAEGVQALADYGVATVVDLRWAEEVESHPNPVPRDLKHIRYEQVSLLGRTEDDWAELVLPVEKEMWKCLVLANAREELREVLQIIAAAAEGPLLFHCVAGKDRTGVVAAVLLALADVEPEAIAFDYAASANRLREAYLQRFASYDRQEILRAVHCPEAGVHNMLTYLDAHGGIRGYLKEIGLSGEELAQLRARLRD